MNATQSQFEDRIPRDRVLSVVRRYRRGVAPRQIAAETGLTKKAVTAHLSRLREAGEVVATGLTHDRRIYPVEHQLEYFLHQLGELDLSEHCEEMVARWVQTLAVPAAKRLSHNDRQALIDQIEGLCRGLLVAAAREVCP